MIILQNKRIRFGIQVQAGPISRVVEQSVLCEKLGFDSIWYPDHFVGGNPTSIWPEAYTAMALMGNRTCKVTVGPAATDSLRRHPATVAQALATLDQITGGRATLAIGAGEAMNLQPYGISAENLYSRLREAIQVIKMLWNADHTKPARFEGRFYQLIDAFLQVKPVEKPPPIYVGAFGHRMLEMTGELSDGWMPFSHTPETYRQCLNGPIRKGAEKVGRSLSEIEPALLPLTQISRDHDKAREQIETASKRFLILLPHILKMINPKIEHPGAPYTLVHWMGRLKREDMNVISDLAEMIPSEVALKTVIWGTPEDCIGQIEDFVKSGCRHFVFGVRGENVDESIRLLGEEVVPYFREKEVK